nr:double zinc ribbon domain-containing protein [Donghicola tyrosinivorans]
MFPARCLGCGEMVESDFALCGPCRRDTHVIGGLICDCCGVPLPGHSDQLEHCDACLQVARPWGRGRAALVYEGRARQMVLALKHGDRTDVARGMAPLLRAAGRDLLQEGAVLVPVPLHRQRLLRRRYNQAALLAGALGQLSGHLHIPDALERPIVTPPMEEMERETRFQTVADAIRLNPRRAAALKGRAVIVMDDVMTSGATLSACTQALEHADVHSVDVLTLARVAQAL